MQAVIEQAEAIVKGSDQGSDGMDAARKLAEFAVTELTGRRRSLAFALAGALADYSLMDCDGNEDIDR